jgi:hypothetical protein
VSRVTGRGRPSRVARSLRTIVGLCAALSFAGAGAGPTVERMGVDARDTMLWVLYAGDGYWKSCLCDDCARSNHDGRGVFANVQAENDVSVLFA